MNNCPAEIVIEKKRFGGYIWSVCQPDCHWAEYFGGTATTYKEAELEATLKLQLVNKGVIHAPEI